MQREDKKKYLLFMLYLKSDCKAWEFFPNLIHIEFTKKNLKTECDASGKICKCNLQPLLLVKNREEIRAREKYALHTDIKHIQRVTKSCERF